MFLRNDGTALHGGGSGESGQSQPCAPTGDVKCTVMGQSHWWSLDAYVYQSFNEAAR